MYCKTIFVLVIDAAITSDNCLRFKRIFQKENIKYNHNSWYKIRDEKLQHDINREAARMSALSSGKIDKYEYLTGEEIQVKSDGTS